MCLLESVFDKRQEWTETRANIFKLRASLFRLLSLYLSFCSPTSVIYKNTLRGRNTLRPILKCIREQEHEHRPSITDCGNLLTSCLPVEKFELATRLKELEFEKECGRCCTILCDHSINAFCFIQKMIWPSDTLVITLHWLQCKRGKGTPCVLAWAFGVFQ